MTPQKIAKIFETFYSANPHPTGELEYTNNYTLLVAVVLSAQATDKGVNKATRTLFQKIKAPQDTLQLGEEELQKYIKSIGLYKTKAANIIKLSEQLIKEHNNQVPNNQKALEALPGVGRKTANVVRNIAFNEPAIAVDTHIFRVGNRTNLAPGKNVLEVEKKLLQVIPQKYRLHAHHWLILQGRYICTARKPKCNKCPIQKLCEYKEKSL
ncbi:MAG: endonuclease III [Alphaproteobacteria bacterium]|nr:endonuclease III [Alphaproteobacteria bacterium]